jgi:hypothetical protein
MSDRHTRHVSMRMWEGLRSGELTDRFRDKGLPPLLGFYGPHRAVSANGFFLSLEGADIPPVPPHPCTGLIYDRQMHDDFCLLQWLEKEGSSNKEEGPSLCNGIDGCCFIPAVNSLNAIDECKACDDCQNNTHPCGSCCEDMPEAPAFEEGATCNPEIELDVAWCACVPEEDNTVFLTIVISTSTIGACVCVGLVSKASEEAHEAACQHLLLSPLPCLCVP